MSINGIEDVIIYEETVDGEVFSSSIHGANHSPKIATIQWKQPKSILIMDSAPIHHIEEIIDTFLGLKFI